MNLADITPVILTYNEEANIGRCLERLFWAKRVVVADSYSKDKTAEICGRFSQVAFYRRTFDCHANQWNFAVHQTAIDSEWVLALDADYMISEEFVTEIATLHPSDSVTGFRAAFDYTIMGKRLRCGLYPPVIVLFRSRLCRYTQDGHTQRLKTEGQISPIRTRIVHDDRKSPERWMRSQIAYARLEAQKLSTLDWPTSLRDRTRTTVPVSWLLMPVYLLLIKRGIFDGRAGWCYALQRCLAEAMISYFYLQKKIEDWD